MDGARLGRSAILLHRAPRLAKSPRKRTRIRLKLRFAVETDLSARFSEADVGRVGARDDVPGRAGRRAARREHRHRAALGRHGEAHDASARRRAADDRRRRPRAVPHRDVAPDWRPSSPSPSRRATGFPGIVTKVEKEGLVAVVHIQAGPHRVVSLMTREAADELGLEPGDLAVGVVKSTNVVVEVPDRSPNESSSCEAHPMRSGRHGAGRAGRGRDAQSRRPQRKTKAPKLTGSITVSAAASLTEAFTKMGTDFQKVEQGHDGHVQLRRVVDAGAADPGWRARPTCSRRPTAPTCRSSSSGGQVTADPDRLRRRTCSRSS